jgi:uncharacterized membrane protein
MQAAFVGAGLAVPEGRVPTRVERGSRSSAVRAFKFLNNVKSSLWFVPVLCVLIGAALSFGTIAIDRHFDYELVPGGLVGGPDAALAILSTVAMSMVSLTALVLTITMVVVQLAMGQFSPRIVQRILRDKPSQIAIGLFVATFVHSVLAIREVTLDGDRQGNVPGLAVVTAFVLVLISIAVLVMYVHHIGQSLRVSALIELVGKDTRNLIDRNYADRGGDIDLARDGDDTILATESGVVTVIGYESLVHEARRADCVLELVPALGEFVPTDAPLFVVHGDKSRLDEKRVVEGLVLKLEPTLDQDVAYGFRMLVDIAERSLSESPFQDPTTAVQAIDRLHEGLRQLARRPFPDGRHRDEAGEVRLIVRTMDWEAYVHLAFDEIRMTGAGSPQVARRLKSALNDLRTVAPPERVPILEEQLELLESATESLMADERDVTMALREDREGIGAAAGGRRPLD